MQEPGTERQGGRAKGNSRQQSQPKRPKETWNPNRKPSGGDSVRVAYKAAWRSGKASNPPRDRNSKLQGRNSTPKRPKQGRREPDGGSKSTRPQLCRSRRIMARKDPQGRKGETLPPGPPPRGARKKSSPQRTQQRTQETVKNSPDSGTHAVGRSAKEKATRQGGTPKGPPE